MTDTQEHGFFTCTNMCWVIGALLGLAAFLILKGQLGLGWVMALIIGIIVAAAVGYLLRQYFCVDETEIETAAEAATAFEAAPAPEAAVATPEPKAEEAPKPAPNAKATPKAKVAKADLAEPAVSQEKKPRTLKAPRKSGADDLKKLKGVGPKLESTLNELGIWHFDQVAKWGAAEIAWVDERLKFKGRIERDGWVDQAKILAEGGETEFSSRKKG